MHRKLVKDLKVGDICYTTDNNLNDIKVLEIGHIHVDKGYFSNGTEDCYHLFCTNGESYCYLEGNRSKVNPKSEHRDITIFTDKLDIEDFLNEKINQMERLREKLNSL